MTIKHQLSQEEALKRVRNLFSELRVQFADKIINLKEEWNENKDKFSFSVSGFSVSGELKVGPTQVEISGNLPFVVSFFRGKIESVIKERAEILLA